MRKIGIIIDDNGNYTKIRTDRKRYEENLNNRLSKYSENSPLSLEQIYDHIKMHNRKDTNCISLTSDANVSVVYGRGNYKDKYIMIKVPKNEMGQRVVNAGQYMLTEVENRINEVIVTLDDNKILEDVRKIDEAITDEDIKSAIQSRYTSKTVIDTSKPSVRKGITYKEPQSRISSYQSLTNEQNFEKNKIFAKLTLLEKNKILSSLISHTKNNSLLMGTIGNAFSSAEQINYGDVEQNNILKISSEIADIFALLQQVKGQDKQIVSELTNEVIKFVNSENQTEELQSLTDGSNLKDDISIEDMYELTGGKVEYGMSASIAKKMFYLAKSQVKAKELSGLLDEITGYNPRYQSVISHIEKNGFAITPEIITRLSNRGYRISDSVNLDLKDNELKLVDEIRQLSDDEQLEIVGNGGLSDIKEIMTRTFAEARK